MNKTIILLAGLALAACNRGGFQEYHHKPDAKAVAQVKKRDAALKKVTAAASSQYYSAMLTNGKDGVTRADKAPTAIKAEHRPDALPPAAGSLLVAPATKAVTVATKGPGVNPNAAEDKAAVAKLAAQRAQRMRAEARNSELRLASAKAAAAAAQAARTTPGGKPKDDVTLPATR